MIAKVKNALRISNEAFDIEINDLIDAARDDLIYSGVLATKANAEPPDPLISRAIVTYCKAHFGYDNPDRDGLIEAYLSIKNHLCLSNEYKVGDVNA